MSRVAVVGLGRMGTAVAHKFALAGHEVTVWNRSRPAPRALTDGMAVASSPAGAVADADAAVILVADDTALRDVVSGPDGVARGARAGVTTVMQMSTVSPASMRWLEQELPEGVGLLDAPVMGSVDAVRNGTLTIFAGGTPDLVRRWTPLLQELGPVQAVGGTGSGTSAKLVANGALFGVLALLGESLDLAVGLGLPAPTAFDVLAATPLAAQAERRRPSLVKDAYPPRFTLDLAAKDAHLILGTAAANGISLPLGEATLTWIRSALEAGRAGDDYTVMLRRPGRSYQ
ncbi:NAD(P)-dependent oxidoreductase [Streptomyces sp. NPDC048258]|uniref:NAD(P)-dependent oxidoreductase n=1 Tax=Streptomyces sp. NPDC048258 TaxID=3365527 RepID=UPI003717A667